MIPGYLQPSQGRVLVDGEDTREVQLDSLRDLVTYVFQEHTLLSESIRNNLAMAKPNATEAEMRTALATASALEFVDALDDGLDTILGRDGDTLSVGQKQRLCIARGLLRDTPILILDEPTAALDPQTENALVDALQAASVGRLVIVIAHRLSTIRRADRIVFLEQGEIRAVGSHDALMVDPDNPYRRFVQLQQGGDAD
jgi:ABC-type multidrug transport system fused ATPase/permease subunit